MCTYDAAGNTHTYTGETFTFNQRGRMNSATSSAGTTNYVYNALGQMIEKSGIGGTTLLMYDEAGHILGEYSSTGALIQETIWMNEMPVATLRPSGSTVAIYYVHANHLGAPVKVTRPSDNGLMWRWDPDTFGSSTSTPNGNPSGLGTFVYNLRFPGQYALTESGLSYNYFRTYDPATGRYIESDPIGLAGGSYSTYAYVNANPLSSIDPLGLAAYLNKINATTANQIALAAWADSYRPPQYNTIVVHGGPDGSYSPNANGVGTISPEELARELLSEPGYDPTLPTQLIACSAGAHPDSVQALANALNATVLASPQILSSSSPGQPPWAKVDIDPGPLSFNYTLYVSPVWVPFIPH